MTFRPIKRVTIAVSALLLSMSVTASETVSRQSLSYQHLLLMLNEVDKLVFSPVSYQRTTTADIAVTSVRNANDPNALEVFRLKHVITPTSSKVPGFVEIKQSRHDEPVLISTSIDIESFDSDVQARLAEMFDAKLPLMMESRYFDSGSQRHDIVFNPFQIDKNGEYVSSGGPEISLFSDGRNRFAGHFSLGDLEVTMKNGFSMRADPLQLFVSAAPGSHGVQLGSVSLALPGSAALSVPVGMIPVAVNASDLEITASVQEIDRAIAYDVEFDFGEFALPVVPVDSAGMRFRLEGIPVDTVASLQGLIEREVSGEFNKEQAAAAATEFAENALQENLLVPGVAMIADLNIGGRLGEASFKSRVELVEHKDGLQPHEFMTVRDLLQSLLVDIDISIDRTLANTLPIDEVLANPDFKRFITTEKGKYVSRVSIKDLVMTINGLPLSLEFLISNELDKPLSTLFNNAYAAASGSESRDAQRRQAEEAERLSAELERVRIEEERMRAMAATKEAERRQVELEHARAEEERSRLLAEEKAAERRSQALERDRVEAARLRAIAAAAQRQQQQALAARLLAEAEAEEAERRREALKREQAQAARTRAKFAETQRQQTARSPSVARKSSRMSRLYVRALKQKVQRKWAKPAHHTGPVDCVADVVQNRNGDVLMVKVDRCKSDTPALRQSIEKAVWASSPLPRAPSPDLFDRRILMRFAVNDLD